MGLVEELGKVSFFFFFTSTGSKMKICKVELAPKFGDSIIHFLFVNMLRQEDAKLFRLLEV